MNVAILGAGSVGLTLAARLARAGVRVVLWTRRPEAARLLSSGGLTAEHPASGERFHVRVDALPWAERGREGTPGPVLLCTRSDAVEPLGRELADFAPARCVVTFQNDIASEAAAARFLPRVLGGVWRETCTRIDDRSVRFLFDRPGRAVVGLHPEGSCHEAREVARLLEHAGIRTSVSTRIRSDKWLKLCINLMSAPNALVRRADHESAKFVEIKVRLLEEAREVLAAAGIEASPCDGLDRSLDQEIEYQRGALVAGRSARRLPLYNQVWSALERGGALEADSYHRRIVDLGARYGVETPVNRQVLAGLLATVREGRGAGSLGAAELLP